MSIKLDIQTNFVNKNDLIAHVRRSEFYKDFVEILKENPKSKNHRFEPLLEDGKNISNPQNLYYTEIPNYEIPFIDLIEIDIHQKWKIEEDTFKSNVNVTLRDGMLFKILLQFNIKEKKNNKLGIILEGKWIDRIFIVPDIVLENITNHVKIIIERLLN